jgi:predicted CopG family antitoxin
MEYYQEAIITTAEETLGVIDKVKKNKEWFDEECEAIIEKKNRTHLQMLQRGHTRQSTEEYKNRRREKKKVHRKKRNMKIYE